MSRLDVVILAAGAGTRMHSDLPKVLHQLGGCTLIEHVISTAEGLRPDRIHVVYGHGGDRLPNALPEKDLHWVEQKERRGTGHAVQQVLPSLEAAGDAGHVLVLYGDVPLLQEQTLQTLLAARAADELVLLTARVDSPTGYGRIVRAEDGRVLAIVEEADADADTRRIDEVNTGIMLIPMKHLANWLSGLDADNQQGEYYLTDLVAAAVRDGVAVTAVQAGDADETMGVNNRQQLADCERRYQRRQAEALLQAGVTLRDPARLDVRGQVTVGRDVIIDIDVVFSGRVEIGNDVEIGPFCTIKDARIGDGVRIAAHTVIDQAAVGNDAVIGPFARLRPEAELAAGVHVGNFVEIKKSVIGRGSKVNHLSYIVDTDMGSGVNIGAGTITCNYDGANKFRTVIEDDAFIGSDTQLVAPVRVGKGATIGAGSTITRDAPADELTLSRAKQRTLTGWQRPEKVAK